MYRYPIVGRPLGDKSMLASVPEWLETNGMKSENTELRRFAATAHSYN